MTDSAIKRALYRGELTREKAISEIRATLLEIEEAVGKYANSLYTTDKNSNDASLFTGDELYNLCNCWNESWEDLYQLYSAGEGKEIFETFEKCAQFTEFSYSNGYSVKKLLSLRMEIENKENESLTTLARVNHNFNTEGMIREKLSKGQISNECALLEAEASCRTIDEAVKNSLNPEYLLRAEAAERAFRESIDLDGQIGAPLTPPKEPANDTNQEETELLDVDDRENLDLFYSYHLHRITTEMVWNNFHDEDLIHDYSILIGRTKFTLNEVMLLRRLIQDLKKEIALARGINVGDVPKERKGKSASEIRMALIRREYSIEDGLREILATIMDIDAEFMEAYEKGYWGGYNSVDCYWGIIQRERGNWPTKEIQEICDEDNYEQMLTEIKRMHYTLEEIVELKDLEEELWKKLSDYQQQQGEPAKPETLSRTDKQESGSIKTEEMKYFSEYLGHLLSPFKNGYELKTELKEYLSEAYQDCGPLSLKMFSNKLYYAGAGEDAEPIKDTVISSTLTKIRKAYKENKRVRVASAHSTKETGEGK